MLKKIKKHLRKDFTFMKNILKLFILCLALPIAAVSAADSLDVFEEYAVSDASLVCEQTFLNVTKNTPASGKLKFSSGTAENVAIEIVTLPKKGAVSVTATDGSFTYTPNTDALGTDSFQFRITTPTESSNISYCDITISENSATPDLGFVYEDMRTHWAGYSAIKLVENDIIKGERIGSRYYFHPETKMRRIDVIEYILAALKVDFKDVDKNETHIFSDSSSLPEYINEAAYLANKAGFLEGVRDGDKIYLHPYEYINRAEIIRMIDLAMGSKTQNGDKLAFADARNIPDWAMQSVKNLVGYGIIKGFEDNTLRPYDNITKAQTAEMIYQMMKYDSAATTIARIKQEFYGTITA